MSGFIQELGREACVQTNDIGRRGEPFGERVETGKPAEASPSAGETTRCHGSAP